MYWGGPISGVHMGTDMTDNIAFPKTTHVESKINWADYFFMVPLHRRK